MDTIGDYEAYQLEWLISHGYSLEDFVRELDWYIKHTATYGDLSDTRLLDVFRDWEYNYGFNGEIYVCEDEFYNCNG